jgi:hypothetical protein
MKNNDAEKIRQKFPKKIPIILKKQKKDSPELTKNKFLADGEMTIGSFLYTAKKYLPIRDREKSFLLFIENQLMMPSKTIEEIDEEFCKDKKNFLVMNYAFENVFG